MLKRVIFIFGLSLLASVPPNASALAQTCPAALANNTTADATQVMSWIYCRAPLDGPLFTGNVGIGTASPAASLHVVKTSNLASNANAAIFDLVDTSPSAGSTISKYSITGNYFKTGSGSQASYESGVLFATSTVSAGTLTTLYNIQSRIQTSGSGNVSAEANFMASPDYGDGSGSVGTRYGLLIRDIGRPVTTQYGIFVDGMSSGASNYGIYSAGGTNYFAGNVGIGTTTPAYKLDVNGGISLTSASSSGLVGVDQSGHNLFAMTRQGNDLSIQSFAGIGLAPNVQSGVGSTAYALFVKGDGTGNVGIGTTNPVSGLDIETGTGITFANSIGAPETITPGVNVNGTARTLRFSNATGIANEGFQFYNSTAGASLLMIQQNGNVGIGTATPSNLLHLYGGAGVQTFADIDNGGSSAQSGVLLATASINKWAFTNRPADNNNLYFSASPASTNGTDIASSAKLTITQSGNVGIGTTAPTTPLYVLSSTSATGPNIGTTFVYTQTGGNSSGGLNGEKMQVSYTAPSGNSAAWLVGAQWIVQNTGGGTVGAMTGLQAYPVNSSGTATNMYGVIAQPQNASSNPTAYMGGVESTPTLASSGNITTVHALSGACQNSGTGTITTCIDLYLGSNTGTITNKFGVYQQDAGATNAFFGKVGIGTSTPAQMLQVQGTIRQSGCVVAGTLSANTSGDIICTSDARLKNIFGAYTGGLKELVQITPQLFTYKQTAADPVETFVHAGFIAQNVRKVIPQASALQPSGYYSLDTTAILAAAVNAIKELSSENRAQAMALEKLRQLNGQQATEINRLKYQGAAIQQLRDQIRSLRGNGDGRFVRTARSGSL